MSEHESHFEVKIGSEKSFGIVFGLFFLIIGLFPMIKNNNPYYLLLIISLVFFLISFTIPRILKVPNKLWFKFGNLIGYFVSPIIMLLIYITTMIPIGIILKICKKDLLKQSFEPKSTTYWINKNDDSQSMKNQF